MKPTMKPSTQKKKGISLTQNKEMKKITKRTETTQHKKTRITNKSNPRNKVNLTKKHLERRYYHQSQKDTTLGQKRQYYTPI